MAQKILVAGAGGAIGRRLVTMLVDAGHEVFGTTRSGTKADALKLAGVKPIVVDVFDTATLSQALAATRPEIVIHQLTDLPYGLDPDRMAEATRRNALLRRQGTRNLVTAACDVGVRRFIAQSIAWAYAAGPEPHHEDDALDMNAEGARAISVGGVAALEQATLTCPSFEGIVLRYGQLYGPGTGADVPSGSAPLHVDAAAWAAVLASERGDQGIYNIAEPNAYVSSEKACYELGWDSSFRLGAD